MGFTRTTFLATGAICGIVALLEPRFSCAFVTQLEAFLTLEYTAAALTVPTANCHLFLQSRVPPAARRCRPVSRNTVCVRQ